MYSQKQRLLFDTKSKPEEVNLERKVDVEPLRTSNLRTNIHIPDEILGKQRTRIVFLQEGTPSETMYVPSLANKQ